MALMSVENKDVLMFTLTSKYKTPALFKRHCCLYSCSSAAKMPDSIQLAKSGNMLSGRGWGLKSKPFCNRLFAHDVIAVPWNAAGGQEVIFLHIGISSRNSRWLCLTLCMNAQTGKTQGAFIMYENVLFIREENSRNCLKNTGKSGL